MNTETVYIALKNKIRVDVDTELTIGDLGRVYSNNKSLENLICRLKVYRSPTDENWDYLDASFVVSKAVGYNPNLDISMIGASEILIEVKSRERENRFFKFVKIMAVLIILFFGSAIAIINFHEDVNMAKSLEKIYFTFTGKEDKNPLIMTIPYTIGMGFGILGFFNRVISSSERRKREPGPMEIESYLYDKEMEDYILHDMKNKDRKYRRINDDK